MKFRFTIMLLGLSMLLSAVSFAQSKTIDLSFSSIPEGVVNSNQDSLFTMRFEVQLTTLANVSHFVFSSGNAPHDNSRFEDTIYVYNPTQNAAAFNYSLQGNDISFDYHQQVINGLNFYKVELFDFQGNTIHSYIKQL